MRAVFVILIWSLTSCVHVPAHERGRLLSPVMAASDGELEAGIDAHVHQTRESMIGGTTAGGVSCGCN